MGPQPFRESVAEELDIVVREDHPVAAGLADAAVVARSDGGGAFDPDNLLQV